MDKVRARLVLDRWSEKQSKSPDFVFIVKTALDICGTFRGPLDRENIIMYLEAGCFMETDEAVAMYECFCAGK